MYNAQTFELIADVAEEDHECVNAIAYHPLLRSVIYSTGQRHFPNTYEDEDMPPGENDVPKSLLGLKALEMFYNSTV